MRSTLTTLVVGATLALTGGVAHATETTATAGPPTIFMLDTARDSSHTNVTTTCGGDGKPVIHTVLYNDHGGPAETIVVYLEPTGGLNALGVPVQNNLPAPEPITIPAGGHVAITLPYENGHAVFNAVAVAQGAEMPATNQELAAAKGAVPPTADNSQLSPPGGGYGGKYEYAIAPAACTPPPQTACPPNWPISLYPIEDPACIPHPTATGAAKVTVTKRGLPATTTKTATRSVTATETATTTATVTTTATGATETRAVTGGGPFPGSQATDSTSVGAAPVATGGSLGRTGTSTATVAGVTASLLLFGAGALVLGLRRKRRH